MTGEANVELTRKPADLRELGGTLARLPAKASEAGMAGVRREGSGHPVHADVVRVAVFEDAAEPLKRDA
jgi:hypothetical protein